MNVQKIEQRKLRPLWAISRTSISIILLLACFYVINGNNVRAEVLYITPEENNQTVIDSDQPSSEFDAPSINPADIVETLNALIAGRTKISDSAIDSAKNDGGLISMDVIPAGTSGTVTVPVKINQVENIGTATIHIHYDASSLRVLSCTMNPEQKFDSALCNENYENSGVIAFNLISTAGFTGDATVAEIEFQVIDTLDRPFAPKLTISRSPTDINGVDVPVSIAEVNQNGAEADVLSELLDGLLRVFLPIVQK